MGKRAGGERVASVGKRGGGERGGVTDLEAFVDELVEGGEQLEQVGARHQVGRVLGEEGTEPGGEVTRQLLDGHDHALRGAEADRNNEPGSSPMRKAA